MSRNSSRIDCFLIPIQKPFSFHSGIFKIVKFLKRWWRQIQNDFTLSMHCFQDLQTKRQFPKLLSSSSPKICKAMWSYPKMSVSISKQSKLFRALISSSNSSTRNLRALSLAFFGLLGKDKLHPISSLLGTWKLQDDYNKNKDLWTHVTQPTDEFCRFT